MSFPRVNTFMLIVKTVDTVNGRGNMVVNNLRGNTMSTKEPSAPYVYQPHSPYDKVHGPDRIYGVGGLNPGTIIDGLTNEQATAIVGAITPGESLETDNTGWLDIESAPKDGSDILTICGQSCSVRYWGEGEDGEDAWQPRIRGEFPTHYQPLPTPPL